MDSGSRSPLGLAAKGCLALLVGSGVVLVAFVFVGQRVARDVREQAADPALRLARVRELLRTDDLPDGFSPALGVRVPLLGRVVVLEREPRSQGVCLVLRGRSAPSVEWDDEMDRLLAVGGLALEPGASVSDGELPFDGSTLVYRVLRARLTPGTGEATPVLAALVHERCPLSRDSLRGVWIEPDPLAAGPVPRDGLSGTPADPQAVLRLFGSFRPCS